MKAAKENKVLSILETEKTAYLKNGWDITDDTGALIESHCKTVSAEEYESLKKENTSLKGQITKLKNELKKSKDESAKLPVVDGEANG